MIVCFAFYILISCNRNSILDTDTKIYKACQKVCLVVIHTLRWLLDVATPYEQQSFPRQRIHYDGLVFWADSLFGLHILPVYADEKNIDQVNFNFFPAADLEVRSRNSLECHHPSDTDCVAKK